MVPRAPKARIRRAPAACRGVLDATLRRGGCCAKGPGAPSPSAQFFLAQCSAYFAGEAGWAYAVSTVRFVQAAQPHGRNSVDY